MLRFAPLLLICALPTGVFAQSQLDQFETISEDMNVAMFDAMIRMIEDMGGDPEPLRAAVPDSDWDDDYRQAGACMLNKLIDASSVPEVREMLDAMEAYIPEMEGKSVEEISEDIDFLPEGITESFSISVNSECGMTDLLLDRMSETGFTAAMMRAMEGM